MISKPILFDSPTLLTNIEQVKPIYGYTIKNSKGMILNASNFGATITHLYVPINKTLTDVVLGFDDIESYIQTFKVEGAPYYGSIVGRVAGRIANGTYFKNNQKIQLSINHGKHHLHGGSDGFSKRVWDVKSLTNNKITFISIFKDGDDGYPGNLTVEITYEITENNTLEIDINATTDNDTIINITQHNYFNLDDQCTNLNKHQLQMPSKQFIETKANMIPTGRILDTKNTPYDFSNFQPIPAVIDTTFVNNDSSDPVACLQSKTNNLQMEVFTNQPGTHIYVGGTANTSQTGKYNMIYNDYSGICFETQFFPDAINQSNFPSIELLKGETYFHKTTFSFSEIK